MNETVRSMTPQATANRPFRTAFLLALSGLMLTLGACRSTQPLPDRMESKYSLKKRKTYTSCARPESLARCDLPVHVPKVAYWGMLETIEALKGSRYRYGGNNLEGFDCSGFVKYIYSSSFRIALPRSSSELALLGPIVSRSRLRPGDLVFFSTEGEVVDHVGIYIGEGRFAHASSTEGVSIASLQQPYYDTRFAFGTGIIEVE
ncbi:MAG: NlpC/P60 family protein [Chlorobiaceae bacterium]|nr:NlpC/P60 family protein [Chlorobiaceae bacterium]